VKRLERLGSSVSKKLDRSVTAVVWHDGTKQTWTAAKKRGLPIVRPKWVEESIRKGRLCEPAGFL
jgi:hypothetical protein